MNKPKFSTSEREAMRARVLLLRNYMPTGYRKQIVEATGLSLSTINKVMYEDRINVAIIEALEHIAMPYLPPPQKREPRLDASRHGSPI